MLGLDLRYRKQISPFYHRSIHSVVLPVLSLYFLGIKNALLIGLFAGLVNVIPYVGPIIGAVFALLIAVTTALQTNLGADIWPVVVQVSVVFGIAQQIDGFIIQPLILGNSVKAHPLEVFLVVLMAGMAGGIVGMIAAIPVYSIIRVVAREFFSAVSVPIRQAPEAPGQSDRADTKPHDRRRRTQRSTGSYQYSVRPCGRRGH